METARCYNRFRRLAAFYEVAGISLVSINAQATGHMMLGYTQCIWTTLELTTSVHAFPDSFANLETDLLGFTIQIIRTMTMKMASFAEIIRIPAVAWRTNASTILTD